MWRCILFTLLCGATFPSASASTSEFDVFSLSRDELLGLSADRDAALESDLGQFLGTFFHDSQAQLVLDLDLFRQLWTELDAFRESAAEGQVDYVQSVLTFFEPLRNYDISAPCLSDLAHFLWTTYQYARTAAELSQCTECNCTEQYRTQFRQFQWIFDVVDAIGKVPAAVVSGNNLWTGSWATCRKISAPKNRQGQMWRGQYCMARFQPYNRHSPLKAFNSAPVDPAAACRPNSSQSERFEDWSDYERTCFNLMPLLNLGLCTPDTCTDYDVRKLVQFVYHAAELSLDRKLVCNVNVQCSNSRPESQLSNDGVSMGVLALLLAIGSLMLFGTCYDIYVHRPLQEAALGSHQKGQLRQSGGVQIVRMFSVGKARNLDYIMDTRTEDGQIRCLHGARFLSMSWVIFGHTYYYICTSFTTDNLLQTLQEFPKYFYNQLVVQAPLAVDSFFLLSGLLTSYIFLVKLHKRQFRLNAASTWFAYYFRRYLRLTPVYVLVMLMKVTVFTYISEGPFWRPIDPNFCRNSWWANLLYINNFVGQGDSCMGWTWYLANDFQLYAFAPILIIAMHKFKLWGVLFGVLLLALSSAVGVAITIQKGYPPAPLLTTRLQIVGVLAEYWSDLYVKPYIRCGPYIVGCIVGYLLALTRRQRHFRLSTVQWVLGWTLSAMLAFYSIFGLYWYTKTGEISVWWSLLYTAVGRLSFALALGWTAFACETNHGTTMNAILGHKMFVPMSKITFCAYLLHPILLQLYYLSRPSAFHFTHSFQLLLMFFAAVAMSYGCALVLSLAIEMPVIHLDKMVFGPAGNAEGRGGERTQQKEQQNGGEVAGQAQHELKALLLGNGEKGAEVSNNDVGGDGREEQGKTPVG